MKEAKFYTKLGKEQVRCELCPHNCVITSGSIGLCRSRKNISGTLYAINYGKTMSISIDPIEKKPLYHFYPGKQILSIGPNSCNFSCTFCQNYQSSQQEVPTTNITPANILELCKLHQCDMVAFTYTEPITWFEFVLDSSQLLQENNIKTVMVTNGFISQEPLHELLPHINAMNIDLKALDDKFYKTICNGKLGSVLESIKTASEFCHLEITNLVITDENDSEKQIKKLVDFIAEVDRDIPLHLSRYFPMYKMTNPATAIQKLERAKEIANQQLSYVYLGNVSTDRNSYCPNCEYLIVKRGFPTETKLLNGICPKCGNSIYGKFQ